MKSFIKTLLAAAVMAGTACAAGAADATLRLHQFLPPQATIPAQGHRALGQKSRTGKRRAHQDPAVPRDAAGREAFGSV